MKHVLLIAGGAALAYWYMTRDTSAMGASAAVPDVYSAQPISPAGTASGSSAPTSSGSSAAPIQRPTSGAVSGAMSGNTGVVGPRGAIPGLGLDSGAGSLSQTSSPAPFAFERMDYYRPIDSGARQMVA